ncbi:uncharacterized protein LOC112172152 [Rosa chinensis]|uniref:uncharacterized protein LOC112172152 n=1 Tax=Rosa chinensis TaxID=74649 RepID=UPI001AD92608|nr:uncharacterized protein LOC112172152 [Rosa chinensis]
MRQSTKMVFRTVLFFFFAILLVTTRVSADEFENEKAKKPKTPTPSDLHTPPLPVDKVYGDQKQLGSLINWLRQAAMQAAKEAAKQEAKAAAKEAGKEVGKDVMDTISGGDAHSP